MSPIHSLRTWLPAMVMVAVLHASASAAETIAGPVEAEVVRVVDGDTIEVRARIWLDLEITVGVRIRGIDAPELKSRCRREAIMAAAATDRLIEATRLGTLRLTNITHDKYAGRALADVETADGADLGGLMLTSGLARAYDGGGRQTWRNVASIGP